MAAFDNVIGKAKKRHSLRGQQSTRDAPKFAEGLDAHQYDTRLSLSGAIPTAYNRTAQLDTVANFRQQVQDAQRAALEAQRNGLPAPKAPPVTAKPFAAERGVLSQRRRDGKVEEARVEAQNEVLEAEGQPLVAKPGNIRASFNQFFRPGQPLTQPEISNATPFDGIDGIGEQRIAGSPSLRQSASALEQRLLQPPSSMFGNSVASGRKSHPVDPNARYLQPGEVFPEDAGAGQSAGQSAGPLPSMEGLSLREKVKQGIELTNADAKPFTGNTYDGKAVSKGYDDVLAVHAKYNALDDAREQRGTLNALRQRVARGGFGSKQAGETLRGLMEAQASQDTARGAGGLKASDLIAQQNLDLNRQKQGREAFNDYFASAYKGDEETGTRRYRMAAGIQSAIPNIQSAAEADTLATLIDKFTNDTGLIGGRSPIEAFSEIGSIERHKNGKDLVMTNVDGTPFDNTGWEGMFQDLSTNDQEQLIQLWNKKR